MKFILVSSFMLVFLSYVNAQTHQWITTKRREANEGVVKYVEELEPTQPLDIQDKYRALPLDESDSVVTKEVEAKKPRQDLIEEPEPELSLWQHFTTKDSIKSLISNVLIWAIYVLSEAFYNSIGF